MSPWPGTPKSQQTPPINPPSVRFPFTLNEDSTQADVHDAIRTALNGLTVHEQAFANIIPAQVAAQASAAATAAVENISSEVVAGVTSFNARTGPVIYFPGLGAVNNQLGESSYETQQGDAGAKILVGDSGPVTVNLNPGVTLPWFTFIGNDSGASVFLMPDSGALHGLQSIYPGGFAIVFYDGTDFWAEGVEDCHRFKPWRGPAGRRDDRRRLVGDHFNHRVYGYDCHGCAHDARDSGEHDIRGWSFSVTGSSDLAL